MSLLQDIENHSDLADREMLLELYSQYSSNPAEWHLLAKCRVLPLHPGQPKLQWYPTKLGKQVYLYPRLVKALTDMYNYGDEMEPCNCLGDVRSDRNESARAEARDVLEKAGVAP